MTITHQVACPNCGRSLTIDVDGDGLNVSADPYLDETPEEANDPTPIDEPEEQTEEEATGTTE